MIKSWLVLAIASLAGILSSFLFSFYLDKNDYGELVSLFSISSVFVLVCSLGMNFYYLSHRDEYKKYRNIILLIPIFFSCLIGFLYLFSGFGFKSFAFFSLLLVSICSVQGVFSSQMEVNFFGASLNQSIPAFFKFLISIIFYVFVFITNTNDVNFIYKSISIIGVFVSFCMIYKFIYFSYGFDFGFFKYDDLIDRSSIIFIFWLSTILGGAFSLGIIPSVAYFYGYDYAAYMGIYFIFWSGSNILSTTAVNNYYWPRYCAALDNEKKLEFVRSFFSTFLISVLTVVGVFAFTSIFSEFLWKNYKNIDEFLIVISFSLFFRCFSSWIGVIVLSFDEYIKKKVYVQFVLVISMLVIFSLVSLDSYVGLAWLVVILEFFYLLGFLWISKDKIKEIIFSKNHKVNGDFIL